jgi:hypothetical protein
MATTAAVVAILATIGAIVPALAVVRTAHRYGAPISWSEHLRITAPGPYTAPNQTLPYAAIDGKNLYVDIYLPRKPVNGLSAPVLMMHPGGYHPPRAKHGSGLGSLARRALIASGDSDHLVPYARGLS